MQYDLPKLQRGLEYLGCLGSNVYVIFERYNQKVYV